MKNKEIKEEIDRLLDFHSIDYLIKRFEEPDDSSLFVYVSDTPKGIRFTDTVHEGFTTISDTLDYLSRVKNTIIIRDFCKELGTRVLINLFLGVSVTKYLDWASSDPEVIKVKRRYDRPLTPISGFYTLSVTDVKTDTCIPLEEVLDILNEISNKGPKRTMPEIEYLPAGTTITFLEDKESFVGKVRSRLSFFQKAFTDLETEMKKEAQMDSYKALQAMSDLKGLLKYEED